jgi:hypothetical protein
MYVRMFVSVQAFMCQCKHLCVRVPFRTQGAPIALALIAVCLCTRLGVPATIVRASPAQTTLQGGLRLAF